MTDRDYDKELAGALLDLEVAMKRLKDLMGDMEQETIERASEILAERTTTIEGPGGTYPVYRRRTVNGVAVSNVPFAECSND